MAVTVEHIEKIYGEFRRSQAVYNNRPFRLPKNFENHFNNRFKEQNRKALTKITGWFLTKWQNIDPYEYFLCGFELFKKNFTYVRFFDEKIILLYKTRDKNKKREINITKKTLIKSAYFVKKWIEKYNKTFNEYITIRNGNQKIAVYHYLKNKIDASFFVFLLNKGMILTDNDRSMIPYIQTNYRKIIYELNLIEDFIKKMEEKL